MKSLLKSITLIALSALSLSAFAAGEVQLTKFQSSEQHYRNYWLSGRFEVNVANIAPTKQVSIHLKQQDGSWTDVALAYNRPSTSGKEIWSIDFNSTNPQLTNATEPMVFAVQYKVNGATYWDNNNGANYTYSKNTGTVLLGGTNVYMNNYSPTYYLYGNTTYGGSVTVKNLAYSKQVKVVYSTNNWATTKTAIATFSPNYWITAYSSIPNPNYFGFEEWYFSLDVGTAAAVDYAFVYTVNGQTYTDNNFGRNYHTVFAK